MSNELRDKIYDMSNSFLPLDMFYNDIEEMSKYPSFNKEYAFKDLEKIADFILDLQSQLVEKDKIIKQLKLDLGMFKSVNEFINHYGIEKAREVLLQSEKTKNQDKISFALEQLEKVKNIILNERKITSFKFDTFNKGKDTALFWLNEQINQQINELKGKVEDVKENK